MVKVKKTKENGIETFEAEISGENIKWDRILNGIVGLLIISTL